MGDSTVWIELTESCQIKCRFCYNDWRDAPSHSHKHMDVSLLSRVEKFSRALSKDGKVQFALAGGDPTAHPEWIEIVQQLASVNSVTVVTHGNNISAEDFSKLSALPVEFQFSIPSLNSQHYNFLTGGGSIQAAIRSVARCKFFGLRISISSLVSRTNLSDIPELYNFAVENQCDYIVLNKFIPAGRGHLYAEKLSISTDDFLNSIDKVVPKPSTKILFSGDFYGARTRKMKNPKVTIDVNGNISLCSVANSKIGSVLDQNYSDIINQYFNFWRSDEPISGCACSQ